MPRTGSDSFVARRRVQLCTSLYNFVQDKKIPPRGGPQPKPCHFWLLFTLVHSEKFSKTFSLAEIAKRRKIPTMIRTIQLLLLIVWLLPNLGAAEFSDAKLNRKAAFWTFKKADRPAIPTNNAGNPIDAFIQERWQRENLHGSPPADRRTIARRL